MLSLVGERSYGSSGGCQSCIISKMCLGLADLIADPDVVVPLLPCHSASALRAWAVKTFKQEAIFAGPQHVKAALVTLLTLWACFSSARAGLRNADVLNGCQVWPAQNNHHGATRLLVPEFLRDGVSSRKKHRKCIQREICCDRGMSLPGVLHTYVHMYRHAGMHAPHTYRKTYYTYAYGRIYVLVHCCMYTQKCACMHGTPRSHMKN